MPLPPHQLFPKWVAPNLLTLIGWLFILSNFLLLSIYDWDFNTTSNEEGLPRPPIPRWVWLYCGVSQFVGYTLDGIDGKQARRTGSSTPVGQWREGEGGREGREGGRGREREGGRGGRGGREGGREGGRVFHEHSC